MIRVVGKVLILILFVTATILVLKGVADNIQSFPSLETRILILMLVLLGLALIALLFTRLRPNTKRKRSVETNHRSFKSKRARKEIIIDPTTRFTAIVTIVISATMVLSSSYPDLVNWASQHGMPIDENLSQFITAEDKQFFINFIEWFGVFYGFVISGVLIKVWEQFTAVERLFDKEADAVSVLHENIHLLGQRYYAHKMDAIKSLHQYVSHVLSNYAVEHIQNDVKIMGNYILRKIRGGFSSLIHFKRNHEDTDLPITELNGQLNSLIDLRGDRISGSRQRIFESFRFLSIFISVMWLLPFYLLTDESVSVIHQSLNIGVTFLVIFVLSVVEDLDEPFGGIWKISIEPWLQLQDELNQKLNDLHIPEDSHFQGEELESPNKILSTPSRDANSSVIKSHSSYISKEQIADADLKIDIEQPEFYKSETDYRHDSINYSIINTNIIASILVAATVILAVILLRKRE